MQSVFFFCNDDSASCIASPILVGPCMPNEVGNLCVYCNICCATCCEHSPSVFSVNNTLKLSYNSDVIALGVIPSFSPPRSFSVPLNLLSYKCMHMADSEDDKMVSNERALFLDSLVEHFSIMCLQEARSYAGKQFAPGYPIHASGHCNHSLGCETWISIAKPYDLIDSSSGKVSECYVEPETVCNIY